MRRETPGAEDASSSQKSAKVPTPRSREWNSEAYQRLSRPQFGWGKKVLDRVRLRGEETVLDAGCGTGRLTGELLGRLPRGRVLAVDLSGNMLQTARAELEPRFAGHVWFVVADLQQLPLAEAAEGIFSTAAFHWIRDHERLFRSLHAALRPGGWLEAQCGGGPNLAALLGRAEALVSAPPLSQFFAGWKSPWEYASAETTAERLGRAGFTDISTSLEPAPVLLAGSEEYREYLANVIFHRHAERIADSKLRRRFLDELTRQSAEDDPPFVLDYWRLNISAKKSGR
ncbi:MAG TPA: methyltransferase domain-containing protein [Terriglobales bacterium]|nr:methyltransferase domain-containing protein [Terriglobales bacterium]